MMTLVMTALVFTAMIASHLANPVVISAPETDYDYR